MQHPNRIIRYRSIWRQRHIKSAMVWLLQFVGALTAPTFVALACRWRSRPQHLKRTLRHVHAKSALPRIADIGWSAGRANSAETASRSNTSGSVWLSRTTSAKLSPIHRAFRTRELYVCILISSRCLERGNQCRQCTNRHLSSWCVLAISTKPH
jgi:hypothetical protein